MQQAIRVLKFSTLAFVLNFFIHAHQGRPANAADITCIEEWTSFGLPEGDYANKLWPSGYRPSIDTCRGALLRGLIEKGDYERFRTFYRARYRGLLHLYLISPGGNVDEAMKIGRLARKYLLTAWSSDAEASYLSAPFSSKLNYLCAGPSPSCGCASACGLIWLGATERVGAIGLHRPRITDPQFAALPPGEASAVYRRVLEEIARYLEEMEAPRPLIDTMVATSSSDVSWVEAVFPDGHLVHPPSLIEWMDASCGALTAAERSDLRGLSDLRRLGPPGGPFSAPERLLLEKRWQRDQCMITRTIAHRDALPAP